MIDTELQQFAKMRVSMLPVPRALTNEIYKYKPQVARSFQHSNKLKKVAYIQSK